MNIQIQLKETMKCFKDDSRLSTTLLMYPLVFGTGSSQELPKNKHLDIFRPSSQSQFWLRSIGLEKLILQVYEQQGEPLKRTGLFVFQDQTASGFKNAEVCDKKIRQLAHYRD